MRKFRHLPGMLAMLGLLTGCSTHWVKPNGSSPLWDLDDCGYQAEKRYPVKNEVVYSRDDDLDYNTGSYSCSKEERKRHKGYCPHRYRYRYQALKSDIVDVNSSTRSAFVDSCMTARGWTKAYK